MIDFAIYPWSDSHISILMQNTDHTRVSINIRTNIHNGSTEEEKLNEDGKTYKYFEQKYTITR
jgi:hypothetical protein